MADATIYPAEELNDQQWSVVDDAVDKLEQLWKASNCPQIAALVPPIGDPVRLRLLVELIKIDQEFRWSAGEQKVLESYLEEWPELQQEPTVKAELLEAECLTRGAHGSLPSAEDLQRRFPELSDELRNRLINVAELARHSEDATSDFASHSTPQNKLRIRCPHCHNPADMPLDTLLTDITCSACGSHFSLVDQSKATHMAPSISTMGRFELIERLGVGGFGTVWKARDKQLDRTVAVKIPRQTGMSVEETEKFFREARAAAQLRHPNIVSVHEVGRDGDSVYIVSDFVRGVTLGEWLTGQQLTNREAAELCAKIADALHHAHEQGVVHRDLKPANIMIDGNGQPHLMDFGLARRDSGEVTVTIDGQILGTPAYMSPEQAQGEAHTADRRSDVYSLGVILFQLLTGELPFRGVARMIMHQVIHDEPPSPRKFRSSIPKDLETITLKCMEKEQERRYQSAQNLAADLRHFVSGEPIRARPIHRWDRAWRWCKRKPAIAALSMALILFLLAVSTVAPFIAARQAALRQSAEQAEKSARVQADFVAAQYALAQGRLSDAYRRLTSAMESKTSWEYGHVLATVVEHARHDWQLLRRWRCPERADWGCFVGRGPKWLVTSHGNVIEVRSLVRDKPINNSTIDRGSRSPCALGQAFIAVANAEKTISIFSIPALEKVATCDFPGHIVEIRSDDNGNYFVALNDKGFVRVFDRSGKPCAEKMFSLASSEGFGRPNVDLSPDGLAVSFDTGLRTGSKARWIWKSDEVAEFQFTSFQTRLESADVAWGYSASSAATSSVSISSAHINSRQSRTLFSDNNALYSPGTRLEGASVDHGLAGLSLIGDTAINVLDAGYIDGAVQVPIRKDESGASNIKLVGTRYESLWPHVDDPPRFLTYDADSRVLVLLSGDELLVFIYGPSHRISASVELDTSFNSLAVSASSAYIPIQDALQVVDLNSLKVQRYVFERLQAPTPNKMFYPCGVCATPDGRFIAILWQEATGLSVGSKYFRKLVRIYDFPSAIVGGVIPHKWEVDLKDFRGISSRSNRELMLTPDGRTIALCDANGTLAAYGVADNMTNYAKNVGTKPTFTFCAEKSLLAVGDYTQANNLCLYNIVDGQIKHRIPLPSPVRRAAFSPDGATIYIGLASDMLRAYRVNNEELLWEKETPLAPVAISPNGDRYIGFLPDNVPYGSVNLVDFANGETVDVVNKAGHVLNAAYFSPNGQTLVFNASNATCKILRSIGNTEANQWLKVSMLDSQLAAESADFVEYCEKLAALYRPIAAKWKVSFYKYDADRNGLPNDWKTTVQKVALFEQTVDEIDFSWKSESPAPSVPHEYFGMAGTTQVEVRDGMYRVETVSDDGIRVWIDARPVIDDWNGHPEKRNQAELTLDSGTHSIRIEYFQAQFDARLEFNMVRLE